jgi:hypothetical protein
MSSADLKPPSNTSLGPNWYLCSDGSARRVSQLAREMSMRHALVSFACVAVIIVIGICIIAVSRTSAFETHDVSRMDDRAISPDAMQRARGVKNLPILKIVDMTLVFSSS